MLVNIHGTLGENLGELNLPFIHLDAKFNYEIGVTHFTFELENKLNVKDGELMVLKSNLVDLNSCNPDQALFYLNYNLRRITQHMRPSFVLYQWMSNFDFENASFELRSQLTNKALNITNIFLQLEIKKIDNYGRF